MANETIQLAEYAAGLKYEDLPPAVVQRAKDCIADTVAVILLGYDLPWSRIVVDYAKRNGAGGRSRILGAGEVPVHAPAAALANGAMAHAFEMDNLTQPNSGSHPGATVFSAALAIAQERGLSGRETIAATVAGWETMIRIGRATKHSNERRGFHAPGTTGPLGAAVACGRLMQFDAERMTNALGDGRHGQAAASRPRRRRRGARREPCGRRLHRPEERNRRAGGFSQGSLQ